MRQLTDGLDVCSTWSDFAPVHSLSHLYLWDRTAAQLQLFGGSPIHAFCTLKVLLSLVVSLQVLLHKCYTATRLTISINRFLINNQQCLLFALPALCVKLLPRLAPAALDCKNWRGVSYSFLAFGRALAAAAVLCSVRFSEFEPSQISE